MSYLQVEHLTKKYGSFTAVHDFSFDVEKEETVAIIGPSGAGKTTLLRLICGLETLDEGTITLDQELLNAIPSNQRGISMIFQDAALFSHTKVKHNITYGLAKLGYRTQEIDQMVTQIAEDMRIESFLNRYPGTLSAGERQRVGIARALIRKPRLLLLDEPFSNLDAQLKQDLIAEIMAMKKKYHSTLVMVTHDQQEAVNLADRILVMNQGECVAYDTVDKLLQHSNPFVQSFLAENLSK